MEEQIKTAQRTFMPEIIAPGTGLSPLTDKSVIPANNVPTIEDVLKGKKYKIPGGGGSWSTQWGDDTATSFKENADDYKRKERDLEILDRMQKNKNAPQEEWIARVDGGIRMFPSMQAFLNFKREKDKGKNPVKWVTRTKTAQSNIPEDVVSVSTVLDSTFKVESINTYDGTKEIGAAFCIAKNYFVTCAHVIKKYNKNTTAVIDLSDLHGIIRTSLVKDNRTVQASIIAINATTDIAILSADVDSSVLSLDSNMTIGEEVVAIGSPHGFENNATFGHIGSLDRRIYTHDGAPEYAFIDLSVFAGNSGGPVARRMDGSVVAMITSIVSVEGDYGLNAGLPASYIIDFCKQNKIPIQVNE